MLNRLRSVLAPPTFEDKEKTRVARLLNTVLWFTSVVMGGALLAMPFVARQVLGVLVVSGMVLLCVGLLAALRGGRVRLVAGSFLAMLWITVSVMVAVSGGILSPEAAGFLVVIMAAGLLGGLSATVIFAGLSVASAVTIYILDVNAQLPILLPIDYVVGLIVVVANIVLMSGLLHLALSSLERERKRAKDYARDLEQERASLEERVRERTAGAEAARQEAEAARREAEAARQEAVDERENVQALNALNDVLRGEQSVAQLADHTIQHLGRHLDAQAGTLFVWDAGQEWLGMAGSYAYAGDGQPARFELGEGLVGQAALEKRTVALQDIPAGELTIRSGLGQHPPRNILVLPLLYEGRVVGAIELGTLSRFSATQLEFLNRAAPNIAIAFHTAQTRMRVNELLLQTQQQAEELQAQEEELRAINEELQAQAESLQWQGRSRSLPAKEKSA